MKRSDGGFQPPPRHEQEAIQSMTTTNSKMDQTPIKAPVNTDQIRINPIKAVTARCVLVKLAPHLPAPSVLDVLARPFLKIAGPSLFQASNPLPIIGNPTAVFAQMKMGPGDVPEPWMPHYQEWLIKVRRAREFTRASLLLENSAETQPVVDPLVAGLLCYLYSGTHDLTLRQRWLEIALAHPVGSWLAAEGLHTEDERERIVAAVSSDSKMLWWASLIPGLGPIALKHADAHLDIFGAMMMAEHGTDRQISAWLDAVSTSSLPTAACVNIVLQPNAKPRELAQWQAILNDASSPRHAYESVRWARHSWPAASWGKLKEALLDKAVSDGGRWRYHWLRDIQPEAAAANIGEETFLPIWAAELVDALNLDDYALRFSLGEHLGCSTDDQYSWTLRYLNQRWETKRRRTPH